MTSLPSRDRAKVWSATATALPGLGPCSRVGDVLVAELELEGRFSSTPSKSSWRKLMESSQPVPLGPAPAPLAASLMPFAPTGSKWHASEEQESSPAPLSSRFDCPSASGLLAVSSGEAVIAAGALRGSSNGSRTGSAAGRSRSVRLSECCMRRRKRRRHGSVRQVQDMGGSQCECHKVGRSAARSNRRPPHMHCQRSTPTTPCVKSVQRPISTPSWKSRCTLLHAASPSNTAKMCATLPCASTIALFAGWRSADDAHGAPRAVRLLESALRLEEMLNKGLTTGFGREQFIK
mmetsp:Transcript_16469/g.50157  ORF Transcript_16469/g.50157 Transcript_16469/m.50157 type:complete len:292 (-) Transcript_16469:1038-1913(-)